MIFGQGGTTLYSEKIYEGLSIQIIVHEGEYTGRYKTKIEEISQNVITIGIPVAGGQFIPLRVGTSLEVGFTDDISAYSFSTVILKRYDIPIPTLIIAFPETVNKIQRRKFVRVRVVSTVKYQILEDEAYGEEKQGFMHDISGGGMLLQTKEAIPHHSRLMLVLGLRGMPLKLMANVIRCTKEDDKTFLISVEFIDITEKIRDKIIRVVFGIQREMRKKGLV